MGGCCRAPPAGTRPGGVRIRAPQVLSEATLTMNPHGTNTVVLGFTCRFRRLDCVYLNAGIMPNPHLNVRALFSGIFSR